MEPITIYNRETKEVRELSPLLYKKFIRALNAGDTLAMHILWTKGIPVDMAVKEEECEELLSRKAIVTEQ